MSEDMGNSDGKLQLYATYQTARTYHLRGASHHDGWALCTVNDKTGELLIVSDWGNWSFLWNPAHLGRPSLTHFIADRSSCDYLACKLLGGQRATMVIDVEKTIAHWRTLLAERRLRVGRKSPDRQRLTASLAREIWDEIGALDEYAHNDTLFMEHAMQIDGQAWFSECPWEDAVHRPSHEYLVLNDRILPALVAACREATRQIAAEASP